MSINDISLTATFDTDLDIVTLDAVIEDGSPTPVNHAWSITRTDALGTATVRTVDGQAFSEDSGTYTLTITDHECALAGLVTYTLTATDEGDNTWTAEDSLTPSTTRSWLTFPLLPQYSLELPYVGGYEASWQPAGDVLDILDRDDPIPLPGPFGLRRGPFSILVPDFATGIAIVSAYSRLKRAQLRVPDPVRASMYHVVTGVTLRRHAAQTDEWVVSGTYREVASPAGYRMGTLGWSYEDVTALAIPYADLEGTFPTYADLKNGPAS